MADVRPKAKVIESDEMVRIGGSWEGLPLFFLLAVLLAGAGVFLFIAAAGDLTRFSEISLRHQIRAGLAAVGGPLLLALGVFGAWQLARRTRPPMLSFDNTGITDTWLRDGHIQWSEIEKIEREKQ